MTSLIGRTVRIKRKPDGKVVIERKTTLLAKRKKLAADRAANAWKGKSK